jgi:hypothetical protein
MKVSLICLIIAALLQLTFDVTAQQTTTSRAAEPKAAYSVIIANGWIEVRSTQETPLTYDKMALEDWAYFLGYTLPLSLDDVRHLTLNAVAAVMVGGGSREHIVDPEQQIITFDEAGQSCPVTLTIEHGIGFAILRDTPPTLRSYRADIIVIDADKIKKALHQVEDAGRFL